jgi:hypothetical protein
MDFFYPTFSTINDRINENNHYIIRSEADALAKGYYLNGCTINNVNKLVNISNANCYCISNIFLNYTDGYTMTNCGEISFSGVTFSALKNGVDSVLWRMSGVNYSSIFNNVVRGFTQPNETAFYIAPDFTTLSFACNAFSENGVGATFKAGSKTQDDIGYRFNACQNVPPSKAEISLSVVDNTLITDTLGTTTPIKINAVFTEFADKSRFTSTSDGTITYIDNIVSKSFIHFKSSLEVQGGSDKPWAVIFAINGVFLEDYSLKIELSSGIASTEIAFANLTLKPNDVIEVFLKEYDVSGNASTHRVIVKNAKLIIH